MDFQDLSMTLKSNFYDQTICEISGVDMKKRENVIFKLTMTILKNTPCKVTNEYQNNSTTFPKLPGLEKNI